MGAPRTHDRSESVAVEIGGLGFVVALGALTAMFGVLLNLILGLSRVVLAMARRGDLPKALSEVTADSPRRAVLAIGAAVAAITAAASSLRVIVPFSTAVALVPEW